MIERCQPLWGSAVCSARTLLVALCIVTTTIEPSHAQDQNWSLEVSGELRERFESANNPVFGLSAPAQNDYLLHRASVSGELRRGDDFRAVAKIVSGLTSSWSGSPPPTQEDSLDALEAYVEQSLSLARGQLALRIGRQEMALGAARLVSVRESPNVRRAFDGVSASWTDGEQQRATAFFLRPVWPEDGIFDDRSSQAERFWGLYATWLPSPERLGIDTYYLGLDRANAVFAQGLARELRHTIGARAFGMRAGWDWNIEAAWQWGSFGAANIRAWTVSIDAGFEFAALPFTPRVGLKADAISGDRNPHDRELGTFNPLFPKLPYFSEANLATPANLLDIQPSLSLSLTDRLSATLSWNRLWKHENADAFYAPLLTPVTGTSRSRSRDIGSQTSMLVSWQATRQLDLGATYVAFEPHNVIRQADGRAGSFLAAWIRWTF
ncbi:alginate export family protein [Steroidobacter agaridevorans]|uniref:alginate export family protein n=1 Tax=Steroidobacter agaridevorans TaxID=2695856 RepID=UPI001323C9A6|nr:alginate export family protein [Steroidobacter agaridevorans]GFE88441.1 alginate export family protein [Steroidobacter agaridevorans]